MYYDSDWDWQDRFNDKPEKREDEYELDKMYEDF
jgi:hypothetical protein